MDNKKIDVILASASPRRKELLKEIFNDFRCLPQDVDENIDGLKNPEEISKYLSLKKLNNLDKIYPNSLIISADTIVYLENKVLGKPKDKKEAFLMLRELSRKIHSVYTGVNISYKNKNYGFVTKSSVEFKILSDEQINKYIEEKNPLDKAGAYGIQDNELVKSYKGSYKNIVGLPVEDIILKLEQIGVIK